MTPHEQSMAQMFGDIVDLDYWRDVAPLYGVEPPQSEENEENV